MRTELGINTSRHQLQQQQQNTHILKAMFDNQHEIPSINFSPISKTEPTESGRFFHFGSFDIGPPIKSKTSVYFDNDDDEGNIFGATGIAEEARYNLATRVMSNGVEVIIAGDKNSKGSHKPNALRILPSLSRKPMTLAPSTLKDQMILIMPSNAQENYTIPINSNHFITKTCLTTYTYRTTYLQDGKTTVESREKVVSNTATEERNYLKISPTESLGFTLSRTPELAIGVFHTTYTYYNTILDGDLPLVVSSQHVLTNTITGPDDYISFLQPSEEATPVLETNTYFSKISLTKTLKESDIEKVVSTSNILTQVIITESLPPRSTAIMTSYIAYDIDETSTQDQQVESSLRPNISETDVMKTQFFTYTYYNIDKNENVNNIQIHSNNLENIPLEKLYLQLKKNSTESSKASSMEKTTISSTASSSVSKLHGSLQSDMHIYATKTYLTTFTYFTTLMNSHENDASSTIVNFHTRVIENVITESIPSFIIDKNLLSKFETKLKDPINGNSYITKVTLAGGQSLEITAINMLHPQPFLEKTYIKKVDSTEHGVPGVFESSTVQTSSVSMGLITPPTIETSNEILDSDVASSENGELLVEQNTNTVSDTTNFTNNNTKTVDTAEFPSVNQIFGSLNFNRLQALGPVFNAMAGLIQNNFGTNLSNDLKKNISVINVESKHSTKNISAYDSAQVYDGPIYIPVQNVQGENQHGNSEDIKVGGHISPQSLRISPPQNDWFLDEKKNIGKLELNSEKATYETPLLNGGIPISPGEVITANSDVIVGKPNGIQPRIPLNSQNSDDGTALLPPPPLVPFSYQFQYQQHPKQIKSNQSPIPLDANLDKHVNFDVILKPPPLKPPLLQHQPQNMKKLPPHFVFNPNYRVHYATGHMHQPQLSHPIQQMNQHIPMQHSPQQDLQLQHAQRQHIQRPGLYNPGFQVNKNNPRPISQKPNYIPYAPHDYDQAHLSFDKKNEFDLKQDLHNNEILEIKRIPEVYSTDLPGTESSTSNNIATGNFKTLIKKVINSDKPMLVDIQPSQITNIVIPRDNSASILIVESAVELHKNGQYYDEPTTYSDTIANGNVAKAPPARIPILSNQQVNLDTNVLSHNVDINVPPITFNKDTDFPHSTPVRGQIQKIKQANFDMPHVKIPITDNQIQVNLTPHNVLTHKLHGQYFNDIGPPNGSDNDAGETLQNLEPIHFTGGTPMNIEHTPQLVPKMRPRPVYNNRPPSLPIEPLKHSFNFGKTHRPNSVLKETDTLLAFAVPQFVGLTNKTKSVPQLFPQNNPNILSSKPVHPNSPRPTTDHPRPKQEEYLQIFANKAPLKQPPPLKGDTSQARPTFNPEPLLKLFYGLHSDGEEDLSGEFSQGLPLSKQGDGYWQTNANHQEDEGEDVDKTEESNKVEDQKASSSLNVGIPTQNQAISKKPLTTIRTDSIEYQSEPQKPNNHLSINLPEQEQANTTKIPKPQFMPSTTIQIDIKSSMIGTESFLDPASVEAVNNMGELDIQLPSASQTPNILTIPRPPSPGRPFTQTQTNTRPLKQRIPSDQKVFINSGEGFKIPPNKNEDQTDFVQLSLPVDNRKVSQKETNTQTESPYNPKYTKRTKVPKTPHANTTITKLSPPSSYPSKTFTTHLNLNKMEVVGSHSKANISHSHIKESAEIFDFHESMNPHNYDFVHIPINESTTTSYAPDIIIQKPEQKILHPFVSEPSVSMQPPPLQTSNVMGLNPPPPPTLHTSTLPFTPSMTPSVATYNTIDVAVTNHNPLLIPSNTTPHPIKIHPPHSTKASFPSKYTQSTAQLRTKLTFSTSTRPSILSKRKPSQHPPSKLSSSSAFVTPGIYISPSDSIVTSSTLLIPVLKPSSSTVLEYIKSTIVLNVEKEISPTQSIDVPQTSLNIENKTKKPTYNVPKNGGTYDIPMFILHQKIPDDILIEEFEEDHHQTSSTIKTYKNQTDNNTQAKPNTTTTIIIHEHPIITENQLHLSRSQPQSPISRINTKTRIRSRIIIPTKYVTNTQILTVTTTKTNVLTSLGIPSTQTFTLTKTKTSTLIDTVTETHTLLQPTRVTESHKTTATQIIHEDYHNIQPTIEIVNHEITTKEPNEYPTTPILWVPTTTTNSNPNSNLENNSIFVVMTDKKSHGGVFSITSSMIDTPENINAIGNPVGVNENESSAELNYDDNITFDLPTRDEEAETNEVNHVLLGGVLIATPPKSSESSHHLSEISSSCRPSCKASRNELCQHVDDTRMLCVCRPGFARMFPDRPCRPTYTYAMQIPIYRVSKEILQFKEQYKRKDSEHFKQLAGITHDAVDRMVMQSDLRDVYHGVHVTSFDAANTENGILGKFLIQLSDNSDEKRLVDVLKKYLRQNNFSLGGTEIFTSKNGVNLLEVNDFNECAHSQFHDCSENSRCFNLQGTYTCSCQEGYADLSENSIYPGRICSAEMIGCEKCHYHGKCVQIDKNISPVCECFHWYTGATCQLNLKILLIALIAIGTILFILLLFCILVTCIRRRKNNNMQSLMSGIHIIAPRNSRLSSKSLTTDKRAMIKDSSSEASQNSLPYVLKDSKRQLSNSRNKSVVHQYVPQQQQQVSYRNINQRGHPSSTLVSSRSETDHRHNFSEQNDRSLTVMIPRAKYHSAISQSTSQAETLDHAAVINNDAQPKPTSVAESALKASTFHCNSDKIPHISSKTMSTSTNNHGALHTTSTGALVSAGFEVSATVGNIINQQMTALIENRGCQVPKLIGELHSRKSNENDPYSQYNTFKEGEKFIDSMDVWLDTIQQSELTTEARSFDETMIQAPTKSLRSVFERQVLQSQGNDEANTMAERDIGSTFLLPHTHLYKPDRDSDVSGFDSF